MNTGKADSPIENNENLDFDDVKVLHNDLKLYSAILLFTKQEGEIAHNKINSQNSFVIENPASTHIKFWNMDPSSFIPTSVELYKLITKPSASSISNLVPGDFGSGGQPLSAQHLEFIGKRNFTLTDIEETDPTTIDFGDLGAVTVIGHINSLDPGIELIATQTNLTLIKAVVDGIQLSYLYVGGLETYGANDEIIGENNLELLEREQSIDVNSLIYINTNIATEDIGGYLQGEQITPNEGLSYKQTFDKFFQNVVLPVIAFNISNTNIEIGSDFYETINISFTANSAGDPISFSLEKNGSEIQGIAGPQFPPLAFSETNVVSQFTLQAFVTYAAGSNLSGGTINTPVRSIVPRYKYWTYSGSAGSYPTSSSNVRSLPNFALITGQTIEVVIPQGDNEFTIYIPASESLDSVLYVESSNANITANFLERLITVEDAGGTPRSYKALTQTIGGTGYTDDATYLITLQ
jgi:hypothetical protein